MSAKHTPGPWSYPRYPNGVSTLVYAAAGGKPEAFPVASATYGVPDEEREANARLIAAAPDLLETLKGIVENAHQAAFEEWLLRKSPSGDFEQVQRAWKDSSDFEDSSDEWRDALDAIDKATGESK